MDRNPISMPDAITTLEQTPLNEHHIYFEWYLNDRAGGPPGYLANLLHGYNQLSNYDHPMIIFNTYQGKEPPKPTEHKSKIISMFRNIISVFPGGKDFYVNYLSRSQKEAFRNMKNFLVNTDQMYPDVSLISTIDFSKVKTIHVHTAFEVLKIKNYLKANFLDDVKIILTCHTPESLANEQYSLYIANGQSERKAKILKKLCLEAEMKAYKEADIMIFPSKEAMEPLLHDIPEFSDIAKSKDIRFLATGSKKIDSTLTRQEAKKKYGVEGKTVVGFIGRHNSVKGYDLLKEAAIKILNQRDDVVFLIGGVQGTEFKPLDNPAWIEAGWVNPADLLRALDVFVLPNRQTYYDLVLLEVLSMGVPTVATATGGNKSVKEIAKDVELCDVTADSLADSISRLICLPAADLEKIGNRLMNSYDIYFTEKNMAERYLKTIQEIYDDYNLWTKNEVMGK